MGSDWAPSCRCQTSESASYGTLWGCRHRDGRRAGPPCCQVGRGLDPLACLPVPGVPGVPEPEQSTPARTPKSRPFAVIGLVPFSSFVSWHSFS